MQASTRVRATFQIAIGVALAVYTLLVVADCLGRPVGLFDEPMYYVGAMLVRRGARVHLDFHSVYPPLNYWPVAGAFSLLGETALAARTAHCLVYVALLAGIARLFHREGASFRQLAPMMLAAVAVTCALPSLPSFMGVVLAVFVAVAYLNAMATPAGAPRTLSLVIAGTCAGLASLTRVNFGLYSIALVVGDQLIAALGRRDDPQAVRRHVRDIGLLALPIAIVGVVFLVSVRGYVGSVIHEVVKVPTQALKDYSLVAYRPRLSVTEMAKLSGLSLMTLPLLWLSMRAEGRKNQMAWVAAAAAVYALELWWGVAHASALPLLVVPVLVGLVWNQLHNQALDSREFVALLAVALFAHYYLNRPDIFHQLPSTAPLALLLPSLCGLRGPAWRSPLLRRAGWLLLVASAWPVAWLNRPTRATVRAGVSLLRQGPFSGSDADRVASSVLPLRPPLAMLYRDGDENQAAQFVHERSRADEAVYVGLTDHAHPYVNDVRLSWLVGRWLGARHYMLMSGVSNKPDAEQEMISDLKARRVRWVVLARGMEGDRRFYNRNLTGSTLLDDYIAGHYTPIARFGTIEIRVSN
jgi:hypothetical protein